MLNELIAASTNMPKIGTFLYTLSDAKQVLSEINSANSALSEVKTAVQAQDGNLVQLLLNSLETMNLGNVCNKSVIYEANSLLEMLNRESTNIAFEFSFANGDINQFMTLMWEKMGSSFGIT